MQEDHCSEGSSRARESNRRTAKVTCRPSYGSTNMSKQCLNDVNIYFIVHRTGTLGAACLSSGGVFNSWSITPTALSTATGYLIFDLVREAAELREGLIGKLSQKGLSTRTRFDSARRSLSRRRLRNDSPSQSLARYFAAKTSAPVPCSPCHALLLLERGPQRKDCTIDSLRTDRKVKIATIYI